MNGYFLSDENALIFCFESGSIKKLDLVGT